MPTFRMKYASTNKKAKVPIRKVVLALSALFLCIQVIASWIASDMGKSQRSKYVEQYRGSHTLQQYYDEPDLLSELPSWVRDYVRWHKKMRQSFPGRLLFEHPDAPPLLLRTCLGLCGGLNDRIGQMDWDLYLANATRRVLLMHWHRPVPLEHFLVPNQFIDWSIPKSVPGFFPDKDVRVSRRGMQVVRDIPQLFDGFPEDRPDAQFWNVQLDQSLNRASQHKILRHRILGHVAPPGELDRRLGGESIPAGRLFVLFFKLSDPVQQAYQQALQSLQLPTAVHYNALHIRVRHPKAVAGMVLGKDANYTADKTGLPWEGETRARAISTAQAAIQCATKQFSVDRPLYVCADSNDLVQHMVQEYPFVVARFDTDQENAHIDKQKGRDPDAYYNTFVDLMLAANAECIAFGVGNYGLLASRLSGTQCRVRYQKEAWGEKPLPGIPECNLSS